MEEQTAFWLMTTLIEELLPERYFDEGIEGGQGSMTGVRIDLLVIEDLLGMMLPKLAKHLQELDAWTYGLRGMLMQWVMTLYVTALPQETVCRVWDNLFCCKVLRGEGSESCLHNRGIATALPRAGAAGRGLLDPLAAVVRGRGGLDTAAALAAAPRPPTPVTAAPVTEVPLRRARNEL